MQTKKLLIVDGIGLAIAERAAKDGANVAILAKTTQPHPKLPGTIFTAAEAIERAGGRALPIACDIRNEDEVAAAVKQTAERFGGVDVVVNNASAISLTDTADTSVKKYDLMNQVNTRGTWLVSKLCLPHLREAARRGRNPHVLMLSPPPDMSPTWFAPHVAYSIAKFGMSMCVLGMSREFAADGIAVNALWPRTAIETAAIANIVGQLRKTRTPAIVADAAYAILSQPATKYTGNFAIDDDVLRGQGVSDLSRYQHDPSLPTSSLLPDFFVPEPYSFKPLPVKVLSKL